MLTEIVDRVLYCIVNLCRTLDVKEKKHHAPVVDRTPAEPPPVLVAIIGPPKVGKSTLLRCLVKNFTRQKVVNIKGPITVVSGVNDILLFHFSCSLLPPANVDGNVFSHVCVSVCPVQAVTFESLELETPLMVHLQNICAMFIYEGPHQGQDHSSTKVIQV